MEEICQRCGEDQNLQETDNEGLLCGDCIYNLPLENAENSIIKTSSNKKCCVCYKVCAEVYRNKNYELKGGFCGECIIKEEKIFLYG